MSRKPDHRAVRAREKLIRALRDDKRQLTRKQACELLHLTVNSQNWRYLHELHEEGLVHIARYEIKPAARPAAVFTWGTGKDARPPAVKSRADIQHESHQRHIARVGVEAWRAYRRAYKAGADALIVAGKQVWRKGHGIDIASVRAAFGVDKYKEAA